jgi:hypothetical protein
MEMTKTNPAPRLSHSACALLTSDAEVGGPARSDDGHRALAAPCSASANRSWRASKAQCSRGLRGPGRW